MEDKLTVKLNKGITQFGIWIFALSIVAVALIDYFGCDVRYYPGDKVPAIYEFTGEKKDITQAYNVTISTPFGAEIRLHYSGVSYFMYVGNNYISTYDKKRIRDVDTAPLYSLPNCVIHDFWVVLLSTVILTLIRYLAYRYKIKLE